MNSDPAGDSRAHFRWDAGDYPRHNFDPVPKKIESLYQGRVRQFTDPNGEYRNLNLPAFYTRTRTRSSDYVRLDYYSVPDLQRPSFHQAMKDADWKPAEIGSSFGPSWSTHWFKIHVKIPPDWKQYKHKEKILFEFDSGDEGFVYAQDGTPLVGLSAEHNRKEVYLPDRWDDGQWHLFYIETSANDIQGNHSPPDPNRYFRLSTADLVVPNSEARALYLDFWIIGDASREFSGNAWQRHKAMNVLNRIVNTFDNNNVDESIAACREIAKEYIGDQVDSSDVYSTHSGPAHEFGSVVALGNCHIDTAWLWPYAETHRKIARSWASQLDLLERYPEYRFVASQAQQFEWLLQDHPKLFDRVAAAVKKSRFIPIGGSWVECDTNMPSGESLARQMLLGQEFFQQHFGAKSKTFWLPDTFGYAPQLPQICRLAGMDRFLTQKLSWNNINVFPNTTFNWVGLDGSQVLCHMPPANTYTAEAHFGDVKRSLEQHKNLDTDQHGLLLFGHGDGGGGPTAEMLEKLRRCRGLTNTVGELPPVSQGQTVDEFFDKIQDSTNNGKELVTWNGELYLEYHRGTYTTQAAIKDGNRRSEALLHDLEQYASAASLHSDSYKYPFGQIKELWKKVCLNQFHDVLPGSGIAMIYEDARAIYEEVDKKSHKLLSEAIFSLGYEEVPGHPDEDTTVRHVNSVGYNRPAESIAVVEGTGDDFAVTTGSLELHYKDKELVSVYDTDTRREVLAHGSVGARLVLFEDQPLNFPAWDTEVYATEKGTVLEPSSFHVDKDKTVVSQHYEFGKSKLVMETRPINDHIEFTVEVDWHETYKILKVEFPVDVVSSEATYETAFGQQKRPTHYNTSWDSAKFEVCGHRYADLSEYDFGVTLISTNKYGYSIHGNVMRLTLLRSPKNPDPGADMGKHKIKFVLAPHSGPISPKQVRLARWYNHESRTLRKRTTEPLPAQLGETDDELLVSPVTLDVSNSVLISSVKRAESDASGRYKSAHLIVRVYDSMGGRTWNRLIAGTSAFSITKATLVNILEEDIEELELTSYKKQIPNSDKVQSGTFNRLDFELNAFEVKTFKLEISR